MPISPSLFRIENKDVISLFKEMCSPKKELLPGLLKVSLRVPFYVEVVISNYLTLAADGKEVSLEQLPKTSESAVFRMISHLGDSLQKIVIALGAIQYFDKALLRSLIRHLNLQIDFLSIDEICDSFFIEWVDEGQGLPQLHCSWGLVYEFVDVLKSD